MSRKSFFLPLLICCLLAASSAMSVGLRDDDCTTDQTQQIKSSVNDCSGLGLELESQCIKNSVQKALGSKWNVYIQSKDSDCKVSIWPQGCALELDNYGTFQQAYLIWQAQPSKSDSRRPQPNVNLIKYEQKTIEDSACPQKSIQVAKAAVKFCNHFDDKEEAASCVRNNIRSKDAEQWNVLVGESGNKYSVRYQEVSGCSLKLTNEGSKSRTFTTWKAI